MPGPGRYDHRRTHGGYGPVFFPALIDLELMFLPMVVLFLIGVGAMKYTDTRRCQQFSPVDGEDGGGHPSGETPAGPDT